MPSRNSGLGLDTRDPSADAVAVSRVLSATSNYRSSYSTGGPHGPRAGQTGLIDMPGPARHSLLPEPSVRRVGHQLHRCRTSGTPHFRRQRVTEPANYHLRTFRSKNRVPAKTDRQVEQHSSQLSYSACGILVDVRIYCLGVAALSALEWPHLLV